jgi:hypothetical protein
MYFGAKAVKPLPDFRLLITFDNGEQRVFDVGPYLDKGLFQALKDVSLFESVRVSFDAVEWANGADLCPETLYGDSIPVETECGVSVER